MAYDICFAFFYYANYPKFTSLNKKIPFNILSQKQWDNTGDQELLQRYYKDNDNEWLGVLLQRYTMLLLGVCMKYLKNEEDAKDSVQQVFLKVINDLPKYKVEFFKSWLYMVAKNHCLMKLRDKGKYTAELSEQLMTTPEEDEGIKNAAEKEISLTNMEQALEQLNNEQKVCVTLFYLEKQSYQQIAGNTGYTVMQVKSHIQNGKRNLKILMQRMHPDEQ
ncbi:MAG: sigma-70 family RNA polymerase sigma factor [Rhizobacter sp.]|nr:sigma-70 family RNA polymerase sigma factor [Ferruginibacter sp.]